CSADAYEIKLNRPALNIRVHCRIGSLETIQKQRQEGQACSLPYRQLKIIVLVKNLDQFKSEIKA
ncbi:hypothetical protein, partial [Acinetobacter defluvii]|uniref:hypothetical protein n=1 Tax=Acinetobacter defluvii TaxID=1871111 RepID=UPI001C09CFA5